MRKVYGVYDAKTECLLATGTLKECAINLGIKYNTLVKKLERQTKIKKAYKYNIVYLGRE